MNSKSIIKSIVFSRKKLIFSLFIMILFAAAFRIVTPLLLRTLVNRVVAQGASVGDIILTSSLVLVVTAMTFILEANRVSKSSVLGSDISSALNQQAYSTVLRSELLDFNRLDKEDTINKIIKNSEEIGTNYISRNLIPFIHYSFIFIGLLATLLSIGPWFFLITLSTLPIYYFSIRMIKKALKNSASRRDQAIENQNKLINENFNKLKSVKLLNGIDTEEDKYSKLIRRIERNNRKDYSLRNYSSGFASSFLVDIIFSIVIWVGAYSIIIENASEQIGTILVSFMIIPQIFSSFEKLIDYKIHPDNIYGFAEELDEIYSLRPENRADTVQQLDEIYSLKFKDVSFDYGINTKFNLDGIDFEIKKGERLGILGMANSGKTTISDLLTKIIRPKSGSILLNNCDLNKINSYYLRELITVVTQSNQIINDTIEHNITYPLPFDEYKYNDALNKTGLKSIIANLDKKDQTFISSNSKVLTESEKQIVSIANAFYKDSKIFIIDEATSKLDLKTELDIINEFYKLKNKIMIVMSNRIANLIKCDKIIVLNNGRIVEYGKTSELLSDQKSALYRMTKDTDKVKSRLS